MATVVVAADVGQGSPTIFPMNGNTPTLSVGSFAARSILADDIKAGTITADEIAAGTITTTQVNFAPGNTTFRVDDPPTATAIGDIWFDTNDGNKTYRASATGSGNWVATTLSKAGIGLGNVDNDSTSTIRSGTTKSNVGLGNVDNDSTSTIRQGTTNADVGLGKVDKDSTNYCHYHINGNVFNGEKVESVVCGENTKKNTPCKLKTKHESGKCHHHRD